MGAVTARSRLRHLDWLDYAVALIGRGSLNWSDAAAVAALLGKAQALLPSDILIIPVARIAAALPAPGPLRAVLADARLRDTIAEILLRLPPGPLLALGLPSPGAMAITAATRAGLPAPVLDDDLIDDAAVYLADFLRAFATAPLAAIVIDTPDTPLLAPIIRTARHYGWDCGLMGSATGPDFGLENATLDTPAPARASIAIPPGTPPETVIARLHHPELQP